MSLPKPCMIYAHGKETALAVLKLAKAAGYDTKHSEHYALSQVYDSYVFGPWTKHTEPNACLAGTWGRGLWNQHPDWIKFDATVDMEKIKSHFSGEPEWDESELPFTMTKKQVEETRKKFNLSPEQWEDFTPMVRDALAGIEVKNETIPNKWISVDEKLPPASITVAVTTDKDGAEDNMSYCGVGYFSSAGDWRCTDGIHPTHWAHLPKD